MKLKHITFFILFTIIIYSCTSQETLENNVIIGISSDAETLNPLFAFSFDEGNITELLFLSLVKHEWDAELGEISSTPMLAEKWEWGSEMNSIIINLRDDVYWSDSVKCTIDDIIFSFDVYSDPVVQSRALGFFEKYFVDSDEHILVEETFEKLDGNKLKINFLPQSNPSLFDIDFPIIPKHIFEKYERKDIATAEENFNPITNGPFKLKNWSRDQAIILSANKSSFLYETNSVEELIFKVVPEYSTRIIQLMKGEIDLVEDIKTDDVESLINNQLIEVVPISGRDYEYLGWNNIDPGEYAATGNTIPNKFFGSAKVRKALTNALQRGVVVEEYLSGYGQLAAGPISPIFKSVYEQSLKPYNFDPTIASELLAEEGWIDVDNDGILEKDNIEFKFSLNIPSGNPRRDFAAALFKNNLKVIGIDVTIETHEFGVFIENLFTKQFDAWIIMWVVPIPINLNISWYSDLETTPLNFTSYQNLQVDNLLDELEIVSDKKRKNDLYKKIQLMLYADQPCSFLYWVDNIVAYNNRIENISKLRHY